MPDPWYQTAFGGFYPHLYAHRDEAEAGRCLEVFASLVPFARAGRLLDLGCGAGRHLVHLKRMGLSAVGLDRSSPLLALARDRSGRLVRGDMRSLPFANDSFGGVLSLFTAFGYFGDLAANVGQIAEIARTLKRGGHWYLDHFDGDKVRRELAGKAPRPQRREVGPVAVTEQRRLAETADRVLKEVRLQPLTGRSREALELGIPAAGVSYREEVALFDLSELDELAVNFGLRRVGSAGGYDGVPVNKGDRWLLVYRLEEDSAGGRQES